MGGGGGGEPELPRGKRQQIQPTFDAESAN